VLNGLVPQQVVQLALVLFLSLLVGFEREEHKARIGHYVFGGVRTFPLIGFVGYGLARLTEGNVLSLAIGFAVVGSLMAVSYAHKVKADPTAGATTEVSGLLTYLVGGLVYAGAYWLAVALGVLAVLLLELREVLEKLTARVGRDEVTAFVKFLVIAIVILPVLPDRPLTRFAIDPFRAWLVLVAVSGMSYASYVLQKWLQGRGGVLLTAVLGGAYSSTATTVVLARQAKDAGTPRVHAGGVLAASGVMYARMIVLIALFDLPLAAVLAPWFGALAVAAVGAGALLALRRGQAKSPAAPPTARNPLQLRTAAVFGVAFCAVLVLSRLAVEHLGHSGLYGLAALTGLSDVDPFVLSLAQSGTRSVPVHVAAVAIALAAAANNVAKGFYALALGDRATGRLSLLLLGLLAVAGAALVAWL
jgi:uncharacterized membrane protein (DUF4010 family)